MSPRRRSWRRSQGLITAGASALLLLAMPSPSFGAEAGSIDHVEPDGSTLGVLYSIPQLPNGISPDLTSVTVTINDEPVEATAELAADARADQTVKRTAVLAIDVSKSMEGERFTQAKLAAEAFLTGVSPDVFVGIVAFAGDVATVQQPSLDRGESVRLLDGLSLSLQTRLYDGVIEAAASTGSQGQRSVLVLSDGRDTSETELGAVTTAVDDAGVQVDVVALAQAGDALAALDAIAGSGGGSVLSADDPEALTDVFSSQAEELAQQMLITVQLPPGTAEEGTLEVSISAGANTYVASAFVPLSDGAPATQTSPPAATTSSGFAVTRSMMLVGLGASGAAMLLLLLTAFGVLGRSKPATIEDHIAAYSRAAQGAGQHRLAGPVAPPQGLTESAVNIAEKALSNNAGVAASIGARLEAAGMSLKPAEWLLMHAGVAVSAGLVGFMISAGSAAMMVMFFAFGAASPWLYLAFKRSRRVNAFNSQLADTLQLVSGGLSAGLSLAQSIDTVVRQGSEPMTTEFKRALVEARLGVSIEDALDSIADRMQSKDFKWVVIAVRIQREVGGNLGEVLTQVAATIRERAYLQRQVKSLSAEGKMSAWILGALPVVVFAFLMFTNPVYFEPMLTSILGLILLGFACMLMAIAAFWMRNLIKMEV